RTAYEQLQAGGQPALPPRTTSYRDWAEKLVTWANDPRLLQEVDFWVAFAEEPVRPLPLDFPGGTNDERSATSVTVSLTPSETETLLKEVPAAQKASVEEILLAALGGAFARWSGQLRVLVDLEGHGRESLFGEQIDVSRTVGWFTTVYPVLLDRRGVASPVEGLRKTKELLRGIPNRGFGFGLLRYLNKDEGVRSRLGAVPTAQVSFNYLGQFDQVVRDDKVFAPATESPGPDRDPGGMRNYVLDVTASVAGGVLRVNFTYSENLHKRQSMEALAQAFSEELRQLITAAKAEEQATPSAADFPLANLDAKKLNKVLQKLGRS
ncbi:MAG: non-ribosomal peptide synthetase, partial [Calditrichaeota bacterium]|nr:non-ribosomal peptide synthetase [Calditrichota bacterium]